jgi:hypothetical protein
VDAVVVVAGGNDVAVVAAAAGVDGVDPVDVDDDDDEVGDAVLAGDAGVTGLAGGTTTGTVVDEDIRLRYRTPQTEARRRKLHGSEIKR